ncbi:hypothetical protein IH785_09875 [candidate division KSB1 bacterium]|nr:hypothetical protein [candidate division KSB1 bacterium]
MLTDAEREYQELLNDPPTPYRTWWWQAALFEIAIKEARGVIGTPR